MSRDELKKLQKDINIAGERELKLNSNGDLILIQRTDKPVCYNYFSFLNDEERRKNSNRSIINLNTNKLAVEVATVTYSKVYGFKKNGSYRLFKPGNTLNDTSFLWASYYFANDLRHGLAEIWDENKNGKNSISPFIKMNFRNDKLHGYSEMFYPDGKLAVSAEFKNGYVDGEVIAYNYPPNYYPFEPEYLIKAWVHTGGILSINQIGGFKEVSSIKTISEKGGVVEDPLIYEMYTKVMYKVDSLKTNDVWFKGSVPKDDFYQYLNGKPITKYIISKEKSWIPDDIYYFESNGTIVYSLKKAKGDFLQKAAEIEAKHQVYLNTEMTCASCSKKVLIKNSKENWGGCNCIENNGSPIEVYGTVKTFFCSIKCKILFEIDCCKKNGYWY